MSLLGHRTKENILLDISDIAELLRGSYLDLGIVSTEHWAALADNKLRLQYILEIMDAELYRRSLWAISSPSNTYNTRIDVATRKYIKNEFKKIPYNSEALLHLLAEFDSNIRSAMPEHLILYDTWQVWGIKLIGSTVIISNQGDYRAIMYFRGDDVARDYFMNKYPPEVLYQHE